MPSLLDPGISIYVALAVALVTWLVLFAYLWRLDATARELKRRLDSRPEAAAPPAPQATLQAQRRNGGRDADSDAGDGRAGATDAGGFSR